MQNNTSRHQDSSKASGDPPALGPNSIVLPLRAETLRDAVRELVPKALHGAGDAFLKSAQIAEAMAKGLGPRSVEYHHGLAFVHQRRQGLPGQRVAMGIAPDGLQGEGEASGRVFVVCLFLTPRQEAGPDIPQWARRALCDDRTIYRLRTAPDLASALEALSPR